MSVWCSCCILLGVVLIRIISHIVAHVIVFGGHHQPVYSKYFGGSLPSV